MIKSTHILNEAINGEIERGRVYLLGYYDDSVKTDLVKIVNTVKNSVSGNSLSITENTTIPSIERSVGGMYIGANIGILSVNELDLITPIKSKQVRAGSNQGMTLEQLKDMALKYEMPVIVCHKMDHDVVKDYMLGDKRVMFDIAEPVDFLGFIYKFNKEVNCWVAKNRQSSAPLNQEHLIAIDDKIN